MVYRTSADPSVGQPAELHDDLRLDASGRPGADGRDGARGSDGSSRGAGGTSGGDAGHASPGENGGLIAIALEGDEARETSLRVAGTAAGQRIESELTIDSARVIALTARGGDGGNGGNGGSGGNGARGRDGADATRYSSGSDGGPGGDGGDGGNGSNGERGGQGGTIRVRVSEQDTPFLMLVREDVNGGHGGRAGTNGFGGSGGSGGRGGSSYSWTETESYTDSNGQHQTRSTSHHNSGGSNGRSGRDGRAGYAQLGGGAQGPPGRFTIEVADASGAIRNYSSRYDVRLCGFRHRNENDDGIYEPEEKVFVSHIEIENVGGMPLPAHHDVVVRLVDDGWIAPDAEKHLVLPRALAPGERHVFANDELPLQLRLFRPQATGAPLAAPETIRLYAELPRVKRRFEHFETPESANQGAIVIRFPIEVSKPTALFSLAPGQATRVRWRLSNVSRKAFGVRAETGRAIGVRFVLGGGEISERGVHYLDEDDRVVSLGSGFDRAVAHLEAEGALDFEGTIAIPADATPYTSARLVVSAELGHIADPNRARAVHYQEITIRVGKPFDAGGADVLLLVNNRTNVRELAAWEERIRASGLSVSIWDVSLEGSVEVLRSEAKYPLVVVLNDHFDTAGGERRTSTLIDQDTTLELARNGTHLLYVGEAPALRELLVPTGDGETSDAHRWFWWPWSQPKPEQLEARASARSSDLQRQHPDRRYVVVHDFRPEVERKVAWIRRVKLGSLTVHRSLDAAAGALQGITAENVHDADFINAAVTNDLVLRALPFDSKLQLLGSETTIEGEVVADGCSDAVVAAVLETLIAEQTAALAHGWRKSDLALPLLDRLVGTNIREARLIELMAWLDLIARDHPRFWEWLVPFARRGPQLRSLVRKTLARVAMSEETKKAIATRRKELRAAIKRRRKKLELVTSNAREFALDRLAARLTSRVTETDVDALPPKRRVLDQEQHAKLVKKEQRRVARAQAEQTTAAETRRALLRSEACQALLDRNAISSDETLPASASSPSEARSPAR